MSMPNLQAFGALAMLGKAVRLAQDRRVTLDEASNILEQARSELGLSPYEVDYWAVYCDLREVYQNLDENRAGKEDDWV